MSKLVIPTIAATCVALYYFSRKRKLELASEADSLENKDEPNPAEALELME